MGFLDIFRRRRRRGHHQQQRRKEIGEVVENEKEEEEGIYEETLDLGVSSTSTTSHERQEMNGWNQL